MTQDLEIDVTSVMAGLRMVIGAAFPAARCYY